MPWIESRDFGSWYEVPKTERASNLSEADIDRLKDRRKYFGQHAELFKKLASETRDKFFKEEAAWNMKNYRGFDYVLKWHEGKKPPIQQEIAHFADQAFAEIIYGEC